MPTETSVNIETDDVSRFVSGDIEEVRSWTAAYNPRVQRGYFWPENGNEVWAFSNSLYTPSQKLIRTARGPGRPSGLSPWSKWTTNFGNADFRQTAVQLMRRASDKLDVIWFGDSQGRIFELEGDGLKDGGSENVVASRTSGIIELPRGGIFDVKGIVKYRRLFGATLTLTFLFGGDTVKDESQTITFPAPTGVPVYGGDLYYNKDQHYSAPFKRRIFHQSFRSPGKSSFFQVRAAVTGAEYDITEIYLEIAPAA